MKKYFNLNVFKKRLQKNTLKKFDEKLLKKQIASLFDQGVTFMKISYINHI